MVLAVGDKVLFCSPLLCGCEWSKATAGSALREREREGETTRIQAPFICVSNVKVVIKVKGNTLGVDFLMMSNSLVVVCCVMLPGCLWCLSQLVWVWL